MADEDYAVFVDVYGSSSEERYSQWITLYQAQELRQELMIRKTFEHVYICKKIC